MEGNCLKSNITVDNIINGYDDDVQAKKDEGEDCPIQINILHSFGSPTVPFDSHHKEVKRKGIYLIMVMASVVLTIVVLIIIWNK